MKSWEIMLMLEAFHRSKHGENDHGEYVICDYDKTPWPCKTALILQQWDRQ